MAEALTDALEEVKEDQSEPEAVVEKEEDFLSNLVGEGRKYKDSNALAKAYHHVNMHVDELKSDLDEYKGGKELLTEVLDEIRNSNTDEREDTPTLQQVPVEPQIQTEDVAKIVDAEMSKRESITSMKNNVDMSMDKLRSVYGSDSSVKVAVTQAINGDDNVKRVIDDLSRTSPDSMVKLITGIVPVDNTPQSNTPGVDSSTVVPVAFDGELTWNKCREIRKENPRLYKSQEFRTQIEDAANKAAEGGIDFFAN